MQSIKRKADVAR